MIFDIRYVTEYTYSGPVIDNINALRVRPAATATQQPSRRTIGLSPDARTTEHVDYFGTVVHEFEVPDPHTRLRIDVAVRCETQPPPEPPDPDWADLDDPAYREAGAEYLLRHDSLLPHLDTLDDLAGRCRQETPLATVRALCELLPATYEYRRGVTYVGSTAADMLTAGAGVCQDFVHVALAVLRNIGIAARYCSGYLYVTSGGAASASAEVETHAWLEVMLPNPERGWSWVGFDPTNVTAAAECHVKIGHGRWYSDVPPIRGIFRGPAGGELSARVTMTRLDTVAPLASI